MNAWRAGLSALACALAVGCGGKTDLLPVGVGGGGAGEGSSGGSGSGSSGTGCSELQRCCATSVPAPAVVGCEMLAANGDANECNEALAELTDTGYCGGAGTGSGSGSGTPETPECAVLGDCCSSLPESTDGECQALTQQNDDGACASALASLEAAGDCVGGSPPPSDDCDELETCCARPSLTMEGMIACEETASSGDAAACASVLMTYCNP